MKMGVYGVLFIEICHICNSYTNEINLTKEIRKILCKSVSVNNYQLERIIEGLRYVELIVFKKDDTFIINPCYLNCESDDMTNYIIEAYSFSNRNTFSDFLKLIEKRGEDIRDATPIFDVVKPIDRYGYKLYTRSIAF